MSALPSHVFMSASLDLQASQSMLEKLEQRLDDGYQRIEDGISRGDNVERWEEFWFDLLHQYEELSDHLNRDIPFAEAA